MAQTRPNIAVTKAQQFAVSSIDSVFKLYKPRPPVAKFVDVFWLHESRVADRKVDRILPTGTLELVINLRQSELSFFDGEPEGELTHYSGSVVSGAQGRGLAQRIKNILS